MSRYVIKHTEKPGLMLAGLGIGCNNNNYTEQFEWRYSKSTSLQFEEAEAKATITFIENVIDWELAEGLYIEAVED